MARLVLFIIISIILYFTFSGNNNNENIELTIKSNDEKIEKKEEKSQVIFKVEKNKNKEVIEKTSDIIKHKKVVKKETNENLISEKENISNERPKIVKHIKTLEKNNNYISGYKIIHEDDNILHLANNKSDIKIITNSPINKKKSDEIIAPTLPSLVEIKGHSSVYTIPSVVLNNLENIDNISLFDKKTGKEMELNRNQIQQFKSGGSIQVDDNGEVNIDNMDELFPPMPTPSL